jgi:hypothetical protein
MVEKSIRCLSYLFVLLSFFLIVSFRPSLGRAADGDDQPKRTTPVVIQYTKYTWWLIRWSDNFIYCTVFTDHEGLPSGDDIYDSCGKTIYSLWAATPPCTSDAAECAGTYLHLVSKEQAEKTIQVDLPPAEVFLSLANCPFPTSNNLCESAPILTLTGKEPIPGEQITAIRGFIEGKPFNCYGSSCDLNLQPTPLNGVWMDFWAESSFGDTSAVFHARLRVVESGVSADPAGRGWYVDVLSSQWQGQPAPVCAQLWDTFLPVGEPPNWLSTPPVAEFLATENPYYYLAGRLIAQKLVDVSACPSGGLQSNGYADECGIKAAMPQIITWQNRFDAQILDVAKQVNIPAQLLKNIFAQESQFWPGAFKDPNEFGLGQITDRGTETILLWDTRFFFQFCPTVLESSNCEKGYVYLDKVKQQLLRGALTTQARSDCPDCDVGVNLDNVNQSISLFAHSLIANCAQVSRIVYNATNQLPAAVSDYENMWSLTAANYHVGPGCISYAVFNAAARNEPITWANTSQYLTPVCQGAIEYVVNVTK